MRDYSQSELSVSLCDGTVFVESEESLDPTGYFLRLGKRNLTFENVEDPSILPTHVKRLFTQGNGVRADDFHSSVPEAIDVGCNLSDKWALSNAVTPFIKVKKWENPVTITYSPAGSSLIEVDEGAMTFSGLFGLHRAKLEVEIESYDAASRLISSRSQHVKETFRGGSFRADFEYVVIDLPADPRRKHVTVNLRYSPSNVDMPWPPNILFAECKLVSKGAEGRHATNVLRLGGASGQKGGSAIACVLPDDLNWGDVPALSLVGPDLDMIVTKNPGSSVKLRVDEGREIWISTESGEEVALYIDGTFFRMVSVTLKGSRSAIPAKFLDGHIHRISARDRYGAAVIVEDFVLFDAVRVPEPVLINQTGQPMPTYLEAHGRFRYVSLQKHLANAATYSEDQIKQVVWAHDVVSLGPEFIPEYRPLEFPVVKKPDVSIVIPAHNQFAFTYYCLCALLLAHNKVSYEVILVDDGSTDKTREIEDLVSGIKVVRNKVAQQFIAACNAGAKRAKGRFITLLNNDTEPTSGWLDELVETFDRFTDVGLAGSKLLNTDGSLQDAGGIVWQSGNPYNYGWNGNAWDPKYCYTRQADYLSGAAVMISRDVWDKVGGLSTYFEKMYFEDADLAFKVRREGFRTLYVPHSIVYHFLGKTSGTDTSSGFKKYQETNRPKFKQTWAASFINHGLEGGDADLEKDRGIVGRVAVIDYSTPRPDIDAGGHALTQEMQLFQSLGFKVTFIPKNLAYLGRYSENLNRLGIETLHRPFVPSIEDFITNSGANFDLFYILRYPVAEDVLPLIRASAPNAKVVFNGVDLHFLREIRAAVANKSDDQMSKAVETRSRELHVMRNCDLSLSYNDSEHAVVLSHNLNDGNIARCPWVVTCHDRKTGFNEREGLTFLGGFAHPPNAEAVKFFAADVMPRLAKELPKAVLSIYGSQMPNDIKELAAKNVAPVGYADSIDEVFAKHRVFVAPLLSGAGVKGKVFAALAHGIPSVLSPVAAEGIGLRHDFDCLIAETPAEWVECIAKLYKDAEVWEKISRNGRDLMEREYSFQAGRKSLFRTLKRMDYIDDIDLDRVGLF